MHNTETHFDKPMPNDSFNEGGVIGKVLYCQSIEVFRKAAAVIKPEMFYNSLLREIWRATCQCVEEGEEPELFTVYNRLDHSKCDEIEARVTMAQLSNENCTEFGLQLLAHQVRDDFFKRRAISQSQAVINAAHSVNADVDQIRELFVLDIPEVAAEDAYNTQATLIELALDEMEARASKGLGFINGISIGIDGLDFLFDGLKPGQLVLMAARPAVGKTAVALHFAQEAAKSGIGVGFISLEMRGVDLVNRAISTRSKIPLDKIMHGDLSEHQWQAISESMIGELPVYYADSVYNVDAIEAAIRDMKKRHNIGFAIVDYLQLMETGSKRSNDNNREREIAQMSRRIKVLAMELGIPILALSQLNRGAAEREPKPSDLRESGALEQDADIVILLDRPAMRGEQVDDHGQDQTDLLVINVAKHRNGPIKRFEFGYHPDINNIFDWDR